MNKKDMFLMVLVIIALIYVAANMSYINSCLSFQFDKTDEYGHTDIVVPEAWNLTEEFNRSDEAKSNLSFSNDYVIVDIWQDWPEDTITDISEAKFIAMEDGGYKILNKSQVKLSNINVSKEIFTNPSKDTNTSWNHIAVNYVFERQDTNYAVQVHYFSWTDYHNETYMAEVDDRVEDLIGNIHNKNYNGFFSGIYHIYEYLDNAVNS